MDSNNFKKIIREFVDDLSNTFSDFNEILDIKSRIIENDESEALEAYCKETYPKHFFDILYENEKMFDTPVELLPKVDFSKIFTDEISDNTKSTIWKYLKLILFSIVTDNDTNKDAFGETSKLFEAINQDEFKEKLQDTINEIEDLFKKNEDLQPTSDNMENEDNNDFTKNLPNAEELNEHINKMMNGKIGSLAKEIAEETTKDLNLDLDVEDAENVNDVFKKLFKNPAKLMDLVKNVGSKLDSKIKSGEIKESELINEASELVKNMKDMPGMGNIESIFKKMGIPGVGGAGAGAGGGKVDMNAFNKQMEKNLKMARMKERMKSKLDSKQEEATSEEPEVDIEKQKELLKSLGLDLDIEGLEKMIFSTGEKVEKSERPSTNRKKKKRNKKKN